MLVRCLVGGGYCHAFSNNIKPEHRQHQINMMGKGGSRRGKCVWKQPEIKWVFALLWATEWRHGAHREEEVSLEKLKPAANLNPFLIVLMLLTEYFLLRLTAQFPQKLSASIMEECKPWRARHRYWGEIWEGIGKIQKGMRRCSTTNGLFCTGVHS